MLNFIKYMMQGSPEKQQRSTQRFHHQLMLSTNQETPINQPQKHTIFSSQSQYYQNIMKDVPVVISDKKIEQKLHYNYQASFNPGLMSHMIKQNSECNMYLIRAYFSYFHFDLFIYCYNEQSPNFLQELGKGGIGKVYGYNDEYAIKRIDCQKENKKHCIMAAIQEYCFYKIASHLEVGPRVTNLYGFDLIIYKDHIEFSMQKCQKPTSLNKSQILKYLKLLHHFNIVHTDIKEQNIMYSRYYGKNVLIDFNCTQVLRESIGQKTLTFYKGTYSKCSSSMKSLWGQSYPGYVDLYYNDIICWENLNENFFSPWGQRVKEKKQERKFVECLVSHLNLRLILFKNDLEELEKQLMGHSLSLFPPRELEQKLKLSQLSLQRKKSLNQKYAYIIQLINQTYEIAWHTGEFKRNMKVKQIFKDYINLQRVQLISKQQQNYGEYLVFSHFQPPQNSFISLNKKLWIENVIDFQIGKITPFFNCKNALKQLRSEDLSELKVKRLYYLAIQNANTNQMVQSVVRAVADKIKLQFPEDLTYPEIMIKIDYYFKKGKYRKKKIWKALSKFRNAKDNFMGRIMAEIFNASEITQCPVITFEQHSYLYNIRSFITENQYLRKTHMLPFKMKLHEKIVYWLIRILSNTIEMKEAQMKGLQSTIQQGELQEQKQFYLQNFNLLKDIVFNELSKKQMNFRAPNLIFEEKVNRHLEKSNMKQYFSIHRTQITKQYVQIGNSLYNGIVRQIINNQSISTQQICLHFHKIEQSWKWEVFHLAELKKIFVYILQFYNQQVKGLANFLIKHFKKYFCAFDIEQITQWQNLQELTSFNTDFFTVASIVLTQEQFIEYYQIYVNWLDRQNININYEYALVEYRILMWCLLTKEMDEQMSVVLDRFHCRYFFSTLFESLNNLQEIKEILYIEYKFKKRIQKEPVVIKEAEIVLDVLSRNKRFDCLINIRSYLLEKSDYQKIFSNLNQWAEYCLEIQSSHLQLYSFFTESYNHFRKNKLLHYLDTNNSLLLYHKTQMIDHPTEWSPVFACVFTMMIAMTIPQLLNQTQTKGGWVVVYKFLEECVLLILRKIQECPVFIQQRVRENMPYLLKTLFNLKVFPYQSRQLSISTDDTSIVRILAKQYPHTNNSPHKSRIIPLKQCSFRWLSINYLRNSLLTKQMNARKNMFIQTCRKICENRYLKNDRVQSIVKLKLLTLINNKANDYKVGKDSIYRHERFIFVYVNQIV